MLHFIDFEVFKEDWLCVINDPIRRVETIIINDRNKLEQYYEEHINEIYVGYNIRQYDQFIFKSILLDVNPKIVNDKIIIDGLKGFEISNVFAKIPLMFFDIMTSMHGLKTMEAFMGHNIHETSINFNIDRKLTQNELEEVVEYCRNDVAETINVFIKKYEEFEAITSLITTFNLPLDYVSKTKSQLSAIILGCQKKDRNDEWDIYTVDTLKLGKYRFVKDWFMNKENRNYDAQLETEVAGVKHIFKFGGLHGAKEKYHGKGGIWHADVTGYYPSLSIEYELLSRNVTNPEKYREIRDKRVMYKRQKNPLQLPYKIVLNASYGICKDKYSNAYDPRNANLICINGQLLLLDLIEKLEENLSDFELIQSNTDGLIFKTYQTEKMKEICKEWQDRTRMNLEFDEIDEIWQKDVNNYIFRFAKVNDDGTYKYERKGGYVKQNNDLDNDMPILNKALFMAMTKDVPVEKTILECNDLIMFQKIVKVSNKYNSGWHNGKKLSDKTFRVFASTDKNDTYIGKQKSDGATIEKFGNTADNVFIENGNIIGVTVPNKLDKKWYVSEAKKRLQAFCD